MKDIIPKREEKLLTDALKSGDNDAFRVLVDSYRKSILRICMGFVRSEADADDIAQDVFIEVFRSINKFKGESGLSTWLYRIAVNRSLNFLRDKKRRGSDSQVSLDNINIKRSDVDTYETADRNIERAEQKEALDIALQKLPENQRSAFILSRYNDLSYKNIAEVMDISVASVESLLFRAKKNMQSSLLDYYNKNMKNGASF